MGAGILASRLFGLVRQRVLGHVLGLSDANDALAAAFRIPNFLQNLFGEGVLSASFIPVYARLRAEGREEEARRLAHAAFGLLALATSLIVLAGVALAPGLTDLLAPGFDGDKRDLTVRLVRLLFPGAGLLVLSAWCLGVLNSHRRFLLSYSAPVVWNLAIIGTVLLWADPADAQGAVVVAAAGAVLGSALQFGVQLVPVLRLLRGLSPRLHLADPSLRTVVRNFMPALLGRGVVQISAFVDTILASFLGTGANSGLQAAQLLYTLPVSLFGISVAAAELPEMSSASGSDADIAQALRTRLDSGLSRLAFFVIPCATGFLLLGDLMAGALFQTGRFTAADSRYVWGILAGSAVGLLAATMGRLYSSAYYALHDTRTPVRFATLRVGLSIALGYLLAVPLPVFLGIEPRYGAAGITLAAGLAAWVEYELLRRALTRRIGPTGLSWRVLGGLWTAALAAMAAGFEINRLLPPLHPVLRAGVVLLPCAAIYLAATLALGRPEPRHLLRLGNGPGMS